jgi:hypothetical protein
VGVPEKCGIIEDNGLWPLKTNLYSIESRSQKNGKLPVCPRFQVRHFVGWFGAGYLVPASLARNRLYSAEATHSPDNPDVALGLAAISMGNSFKGDYAKLAQDFWHLICGGTSDLKF